MYNNTKDNSSNSGKTVDTTGITPTTYVLDITTGLRVRYDEWLADRRR